MESGPEKPGLSPSLAVSFLLRHGFSFDLAYSNGVPYLSRREETDIEKTWTVKDVQKGSIADMPLKQEDLPLIDHVRRSIQKWKRVPADKREDYLNIPDFSDGEKLEDSVPSTLNRYQIRLVHQIVRSENSDLKTVGKGNFVQITPFNDKNLANEKTKQAKQRARDLSQAVEFRWLIEALMGGDIDKMPLEYFRLAIPMDHRSAFSDDIALKDLADNLQRKLKNRYRRRLLIGHNCFADFINLYACFIGELPESIQEFKREIRKMFVGIVDTKHMASFDAGWHSTSLKDVEEGLRKERMPRIEVPAEFERYTLGESYHEAGYDSFLTANVAIKLSAKLEKEGKYPGPEQKLSISYPAEEEDQSDENYITAPQSIADSESVLSNFTSTVSETLSTTHTTITNSPQNDLASTGYQFADTTSSRDETRHKIMEIVPATAKTSVLAVRDRPVKRSKSIEVEEIKDTWTADNIDRLPDKLNNLGKHMDGAWELETERESWGEHRQVNGDQSSDLLIWSDEEEKEENDEQDEAEAEKSEDATDEILSDEKISLMVKNGELMPRWDGGREFWKAFGMKLQVNGCEARICDLSSP